MTNQRKNTDTQEAWNECWRIPPPKPGQVWKWKDKDHNIHRFLPRGLTRPFIIILSEVNTRSNTFDVLFEDGSKACYQWNPWFLLNFELDENFL